MKLEQATWILRFVESAQDWIAALDSLEHLLVPPEAVVLEVGVLLPQSPRRDQRAAGVVI